MTIEADADIRRREAAEWFARLNQRKVTTTDVKAFSLWRRVPENAQAFDRLQAMWDASATLAENPEIAAATRQALDRNRKSAKPGDRLVGLLKPLGAMGLLAALVGGGVWFWTLQQPTTYATAIGEQRVVHLADGSRITLDTASRISVRFTDGRRLVTLASGQALFDVEGDPARPFVVTAGSAQVTALGTRFDVRRVGEGARVVLVEGRVAVHDRAKPDGEWSLKPGQQVTTSARQPAVIPARLPTATSWTTGRLIFEDTPVSVAVAEVNRYSRRPIELRDTEVASIRVSGVFNTGDVDGFVAALSDLYPLESSRATDGRIILSTTSKK